MFLIFGDSELHSLESEGCFLKVNALKPCHVERRDARNIASRSRNIPRTLTAPRQPQAVLPGTFLSLSEFSVEFLVSALLQPAAPNLSAEPGCFDYIVAFAPTPLHMTITVGYSGRAGFSCTVLSQTVCIDSADNGLRYDGACLVDLDSQAENRVI